MRHGLWLGVLLLSSLASGQTCTSYVVIDPFDHKTTMGINGLHAEDFEAKLANSSVPIVSVTQSFNGRLLLLLETSGTAEDSSLAARANELANLAAEAPTWRSVGFGIFAERAMFMKGFSTDKQERRSSINELMAQAGSLGKQTALYDALHQALALFGQHLPGDTILLVSDGFDNHSKRNAGDMEKEFLAQGTRLLVMMRPRVSMVPIPGQQFRWAPDGSRGVGRSPGRSDLARLSSKTGGAYTGFNPHFFEFAWAGYMLGIAAPANLEKPKEFNLRLRGTAAKAHPDALIYQPWELPLCSPVH